MQINLQPSTSPQPGELTQEGNLTPHSELHFSDIPEIIRHLSKHVFSPRHIPESAQLCGHRGMEGKALLPEVMTLQ